MTHGAHCLYLLRGRYYVFINYHKDVGAEPLFPRQNTAYLIISKLVQNVGMLMTKLLPGGMVLVLV